MALTACAECGAQISTDAATCPQCGARRRRSKRLLWLPLVAVAALGGILITGGRINEAKAEKDKEACAAAIQSAVARSSSSDEAAALVRSDPRAREVCAGFEMNGVPIVQ